MFTQSTTPEQQAKLLLGSLVRGSMTVPMACSLSEVVVQFMQEMSVLLSAVQCTED